MEPEFTYHVLVPDSRRNSYRSTEELIEAYVALLAPLVEAAVVSDAVVFLDKSARPLAWMLRALWALIGPQIQTELGPGLVDPPPFKFVRIDRLDWRLDRRVPIAQGKMRPISQDALDGLRAIFVVNGQDVLDRKRILIVDEQSETGDTLLVARRLFESAFPNAAIRTIAWITSRIDPQSGERVVTNIPSWYPLEGNWTTNEDQTGRGVFDPQPYDAAAPVHGPRFPPASYQFLCTPATKDAKSEQLRREIRQIVLDIRLGRLFPAILTPRIEVLGTPANDYRRLATGMRARRTRAG